MRSWLKAWGAWFVRLWRAPAPAWTLPPAERSRRFSPEEQERRAGEARGVLEHPLFIEALQSIETYLRRARERAPITDTDTHTRLVLMEQCQAQLVSYLRNLMMTGELSKAQLRRDERLLRRVQEAYRRGLRN